MKIRNIQGSSKVNEKPPRGYSSWLDYWEVNANRKLQTGIKYKCPACRNAFERANFDGCHVQKVDSTDSKWYIIPLCNSCSHRIDIPDIGDIRLVDVPSNLGKDKSDY